MAIDNNSLTNIRWVVGLVSMVTVGVTAAWTTRDFADTRAKEVLSAFKDALRHHESGTHPQSVRRDEYQKDLSQIQQALIRIDDKLDRLVVHSRKR